MIFRVCEHYDDNESIIEDKYNECFICFEYKIYSENKPTNLQKQNLYFNNCICDGAVHFFCLQKWINNYKSCPICRTNIIENNNLTLIIYNYMPYGIKIYTFIKNVSIIFLRIWIILFTVYVNCVWGIDYDYEIDNM